MEDIRANLKKINDQIKTAAESCGRSADDVLLVAVSKTRTPEEINTAIDAGCLLYTSIYRVRKFCGAAAANEGEESGDDRRDGRSTYFQASGVQSEAQGVCQSKGGKSKR